MGIPKFFRWAGDRYRAIVSGIIGEQEDLPSIDNLYFDMNGVIHNCSHNNEGVLQSKSTDEILATICEWLQYMITVVVKPQKMIYFAVDGVAPRAKLNQQRARRFRSAADRKIQLEQARTNGISVENSFDSNCITPGTAFMVEICNGLRAFIAQKMLEDPMWSKLEIYFSGCEVPGEGEHKIISYIRDQKEKNAFPPNLRHCIYGADADMILLALATHEPYTVIIREILEINRATRKGGVTPPPPPEPTQDGEPKRKKLQFIRVNVLRECLINEFAENHEESEYDGERFLDDFIFLTFLVGNDFLPHLPGIDIGDSAFDVIFDAYKTTYASEPGYLVTNGKLDYKRLQTIVHLIGESEAVIFQENEVARAAKAARQFYRSKFLKSNRHEVDLPCAGHRRECSTSHDGVSSGKSPLSPDHTPSASELSHYSADDHRRLYYANKFNFSLIKKDNKASEVLLEEHLQPVIKDYLGGLAWCLAYYTQGCVSWSWYYPYHYGIFLQDMKNLEEIGAAIDFELSTPLKPFQQLLACLPPFSANLLPPIYREIMTSPSSPLHSMYPIEFATDLNGKKNDYEAVVLLPFMEAKQLLETEKTFVTDRLATTNKPLTVEDHERNEFGVSYYYKVHPHTDEAPHLDLHIEEIPMNITPGNCFEPVLTPGTSATMSVFPDLHAVQTSLSYGHTIYFHSDGSGRGKGRSRSGRGHFSRDNHEGSDGRGRRQRKVHVGGGKHSTGGKNAAFGGEHPGEAFPMPGVTMVPSLTSYVTKSPATAAEVAQAVQTVASVLGSTSTSPLVFNLVLDDNADQFLSALTLQIQQQVPQFLSFANLPLGRLSYTTVPSDDLEANMEYSKVSYVLSHHAWDKDLNATVKVRDLVQKVSDIFGPLIIQLNAYAHAVQLSDGTTHENAGTRIAISFSDHSHLGQIEQFLDSRLHDMAENMNSLAALPKGVQVQFPREIIVGEYFGADADHFAQCLTEELTKFAAHFPSFYCHIFEAYGTSSVSGDTVDLQLNLSGEM